MRGPRYDRILAGTALALVLALAPSAYAQPDLLEGNMPLLERSAPPQPTAADVIGITGNTGTTATTTEVAPSESAAPPPPPDPLASLDPADRPIAEKMRDLLNAKVDR